MGVVFCLVLLAMSEERRNIQCCYVGWYESLTSFQKSGLNNMHFIVPRLAVCITVTRLALVKRKLNLNLSIMNYNKPLVPNNEIVTK